jgi:hypothetical protein
MEQKRFYCAGAYFGAYADNYITPGTMVSYSLEEKFVT